MAEQGPEVLRDYQRRLRAEEEAVEPSPLPPEPQWVAGYRRELSECDPPSHEEMERPSLETTRAMMANAISEYLSVHDPPHMLLLRSAPGVGKTTAAVHAAEGLAEKRAHVLYAGPRHDFFQDVLAVARRPELWYEWLPRQAADVMTGKVETCPHAAGITTWMRRGWRGMLFCGQVCGWDFVGKRACPYLVQQNEARGKIVFGQHQHVTLGHPLAFGYLMGDESPIAQFAHPWRIPTRWIRPDGMGYQREFLALADALRDLSERGMRVWGKELLAVLGGPERVAAACEDFLADADALKVPSIRRASDASGVDYGHLPFLRNMLDREARLALEGGEYLWRVEVGSEGLTLYLRRGANERMPASVVWLDATAHPKLYEACFRRPVKVVEAHPRMRGRVFQVHGRMYGKSGLDESSKRMKEMEATAWRIIDEHNYRNPGIITFKGVIERGELAKGLEHGHFYAARGTNQFLGCDALIVAGTPQPSVREMVKLGKMLFHDRDQPFRSDWGTRQLRFPWIAPDGRGRQYPASGFWGDPDLGAILWTCREAELVQAAHRARPLLHDVDVWLLSSLALDDLPLSGLLDAREIFDAPEGVNVFRWQEVVVFADKCYAEHGEVSAVDLEREFEWSRPTARKYLKKLYEHYPTVWEFVPALTKKKGRGKDPSKLKRRS